MYVCILICQQEETSHQ